MMIRETGDLQQLIHILQQQFPNEKDVPIKDSLDDILDRVGQGNMLVDLGLLDGMFFLNVTKILLLVQGLLESHTGTGAMKALDAYDHVIDVGEDYDERALPIGEPRGVPSYFDQIAEAARPQNILSSAGIPHTVVGDSDD